jgi:signal transduction histidine kinase
MPLEIFRIRIVLGATLAALALVAGAVYFYVISRESANDVIERNTALTQESVYQLTMRGKILLDSLSGEGFFARTSLSRNEEKRIDSLLSRLTANELKRFGGMEGGFYFTYYDQFFGYSFPTSPPPEPAFGPPPRSYHIIRDQVYRTIASGHRIVDLHRFDPATFPLVTEPLIVNGKIVGAIWGRIHIERLLPTIQLTSVLIVAAIASLIGFVVVMVFALTSRNRAEEIRFGLDKLHNDSSFRFSASDGIFGTITNSINEMVDARTHDQHRREELERELHQQDKMASLGKLIAGVSHEIKTPVAIMKTRIQMWQRDMSEMGITAPAENILSKESLQLVVHEIDRLSRLVKRLLVFSKPVTPKLQEQDLNTLIQHTLDIVRTGIEEKNLSLSTSYDSQLPALVIDPQGMEQVLLNVIMNALEAMGTGDRLLLSTRYCPDIGKAEILVEDTGPGIPEDLKTKVFDPFFTTKQQGVGLGLSISYEIVKAHRGSIEFLSAGVNGTICKILLPVTKRL